MFHTLFVWFYDMRKLGLVYFLLLMPFVARADEGAFAPQWLKLLHYQKSGSGYVSVVEKGNFFLSEKGLTSPEEEYAASITVFNQKDDLKKCTYPARFIYLQRIGKVTGSLDECEEYQKFLSDVQPKAVTMLFTDAYMNNPSSMFGHTLFRIDTKRKGTQLLAHGANFGADTGDETGAMYALKGLWGGYYGNFGVHPYYDVINLYNNIENRDIWEYQLNLSDDELEMFVAHLWEMQDAKIRYYFASKNCSYVLLLMLEAIRPELDIASQFKYYTVPLTTIKVVNRIPGFVKNVNYRPSRQSKLKYRAKQMNSQQKKVFKNIIKKDIVDLSSLDDEEKADVLETAYQYVQYQYVEKKLELKDYRKKSFKLLQERSKIANQHQYFDELKEGADPVGAHEAKQIGVLFGARRGKAFQEIDFKPVYSSLTEDSYGLLKGAEINMLSARLRHYDQKNKYVLQNLDIMQIKSLFGCDMMFSPMSFEINMAIKRIFDSKTEEDHTAAVLSFGGGQSYALTENLLVYGMGEPVVAYGGGIHRQAYVGLIFKGGFYYNYGKWRLNAEARQGVATNYLGNGQTYVVEGAYGLTRNLMAYVSYQKFNGKWHDDEEIMAGVKFNF